MFWHEKGKQSLREGKPEMKVKGGFCLPFREVTITIFKNKVYQSLSFFILMSTNLAEYNHKKGCVDGLWVFFKTWFLLVWQCFLYKFLTSRIPVTWKITTGMKHWWLILLTIVVRSGNIWPWKLFSNENTVICLSNYNFIY